jgi:pimeloyl-ACP methyl ester carboxylesterase
MDGLGRLCKTSVAMTEDAAKNESANTPATITRRAPAPPGAGVLRFWFGTLGRVLPSPMAVLARRLWLTTRRFPLSARESAVLGAAERRDVEVGGKRVAVYAWGDGPTVLLVHGWHGSAAHFAEFVDPLTAAGYRAVAIDAPAHGESPGTQTTLIEVAAAVEAVGRGIAPVYAVVGHSFGAPCVTTVLAEGRFGVQKAVLISPPAHLEGLLHSFTETLGIPPGVARRLRARLEREFGAHIWERYSPATHAQTLTLPALMIHDADDRSVPIAEAELLSGLWRGARLVRTQGLGHRRILGDVTVIGRVVDFLRE